MRDRSYDTVRWEFASRAFDAWAIRHGIEHHLIRPGTPVESAFAESFNGRLRDEFLNQRCFNGLRHARELGEEWRTDNNHVRPHTALGGVSPEQFLAEPPGAPPALQPTDTTNLQAQT